MTRRGIVVRRCFGFTVAALLALGSWTGAQAADIASKCTASVAPEGSLAAWAAPVPLNAGGNTDTAVPLAVDQAARLTLLPTPEVRYPVRPEKPGGSVSYGGLVALTVEQAGTYRVALGSPAWIDVVAAGKPVASVAHGHGPDCSGIRKMVDFALEPGRYVVQLSASGEAQTSLLVVRQP